jgi:hypothetical protein
VRKTSHGSYGITEAEGIADNPEGVAVTCIKMGASVEVVVFWWYGAEGLVIQ